MNDITMMPYHIGHHVAGAPELVVICDGEYVWATYAADWDEAVANHDIQSADGYIAACAYCRELTDEHADALIAVMSEDEGEVPDWNWTFNTPEHRAVERAKEGRVDDALDNTLERRRYFGDSP